MELDPAIAVKMDRLCLKGTDLCEAEKYGEALGVYRQALALVPEPIEDWEASTWILTAMGDCCFEMAEYDQAFDYLLRAEKCPEALGNPFVMLRAGQCAFELGDTKLANDYLARAYMLGGKEIFDGEDPKYFARVKEVLDGVED